MISSTRSSRQELPPTPTGSSTVGCLAAAQALAHRRQASNRAWSGVPVLSTVAALAAGVPASIDGAECVEKSWPEFWQVLQTCLGAEVTLL